jgi:hypothetical protein
MLCGAGGSDEYQDNMSGAASRRLAKRRRNRFPASPIVVVGSAAYVAPPKRAPPIIHRLVERHFVDEQSQCHRGFKASGGTPSVLTLHPKRLLPQPKSGF